MHLIRKLAVVLVALGSVSIAHADVIQYSFSGSFGRLLIFDTVDQPEVALGDEFSGLFSYDDSTPLFSVIEPDTRSRYSTGAISIETRGNSYAATSGPQLQIFDNWEFPSGSGSIDDFFLSVRLFDLLGDGYYLLQLNMRDHTTTVLDDLTIPSRDQVENLAGNGQFFLRRFSSINEEQWEADGSFFGISPVPEPGTLALFGIGLAGMALARRRKRLA